MWRPILAWSYKYRMETIAGAKPSEPFIQLIVQQSQLRQWWPQVSRFFKLSYRKLKLIWSRQLWIAKPIQLIRAQFFQISRSLFFTLDRLHFSNRFLKLLAVLFALLIAYLIGGGAFHLINLLTQVTSDQWIPIITSTLFTTLRVVFCLILSSLWAVPVGVWIGTSIRRVKIAQPIIQIMASFPAPMVFPLILELLFLFGIDINYSSMFLMMFGVQWYILFNVIAGALQISDDLKNVLGMVGASRWQKWRTLYLPSIFPSLISGMLSATGGAWNASIVSEYISYNGNTLEAHGLGAMISRAAANEDFKMLAASLTVMVTLVIILNRTVWAKMFYIVETRFRYEK